MNTGERLLTTAFRLKQPCHQCYQLPVTTPQVHRIFEQKLLVVISSVSVWHISVSFLQILCKALPCARLYFKATKTLDPQAYLAW